MVKYLEYNETLKSRIVQIKLSFQLLILLVKTTIFNLFSQIQIFLVFDQSDF